MPFKPQERQYRSFAAQDFRAFDGGEGEGQNDTYFVRGYFCTFNDPYELFPDYFEEIDPHAFDECDMSDVILQVNHDGHVYSRTRNGSLKLSFDEHGGIGDADLGGSKQGREELYESISNGLVDRMSFGFTIADDGFEYTVDGEGVCHTRITKINKLFDISAIEGFPANEGTEISARSLHDAITEAERKKAEAEQQQEEQRAADSAAIRRRRAKALELKGIKHGYSPE